MHSEDSSHNCVHTSRLGTLPGEFVKYVSVLRLQASPDICVVVGVGAVVGAVVVAGAAVVRGGAAVSGLVKETEPPDDALVFVHAVLA